MSSLSERFERSLALGKTLPPLSDNAAKLEMYALFKQAKQGTNASPRPGMLDFVGRAKWDAWSKLGDMSQDDAKLKYIAIIEELAAKNGAAEQDEDLDIAGASNDLQVEVSEAGLLTIQLNRPSKFNAIDIAMYEGIMKAMESSKAQNQVKAVLLKSSGDYFSSGNDLSMFTSNPDGLSLEAMAEKGAVLLENVVNTFITYPKPVVAAVQGPAVGIAVTILALCDLVYLKETATLHTPFTSLGQSPEACSSLLFPRIMGSARANAMLLLGEKLSAKDALDTGLATEVFGAAEFDAKVQEKLELLLSRYPQAIQRSKALIRSPETVKELQEVNHRECATLKELWLGPECMDAILKFQSQQQQHCQDLVFQVLDRTLRGYDERDDGGDSPKGTIDGCLDEVMFGLETPDFTVMQLRSETLGNQPLDGAVLAQFAAPTPTDPFQFMGITWMVGEPGWPLNLMVNPRDFVFTSATGIINRVNGERIGYEVVQSIDLPQCPPLPKPMVRGKLMYGAIYKQRDDGKVDAYIQMYVETQGNILDKVVIAAMWESMLGFWDSPRLSELKKLKWCIDNRSVERRQHASAPTTTGWPSESRHLDTSLQKKSLLSRHCGAHLDNHSSCVLCAAPFRPGCKVKRKLKVPGDRGPKLLTVNVAVCQPCLSFVQQQQPAKIAVHNQELRDAVAEKRRSCSRRMTDCETREHAASSVLYSPTRYPSISSMDLAQLIDPVRRKTDPEHTIN
ncbi:Enoyl-CoA delta isomerase 2, mitochondrial [Phytophthora boehmeriae]|uniref:Enoyl-CoA delta isomerase 2, mitochondrial n=1 Tax=Phytophthora boehmeriae TaxID=109152 RepID=A0A8T1WVF2_9STRA|nr:Enoyl-CoA delta isomerase 2, mitochondrial [Phytophthora boehmeriae]